MSADARLLGAVLAGGESRRFGRDKGAETVGDLTLVERAARTLEEVFDDVVIVAPERYEGGRESLPDLRPGRGPLAAIETALAAAVQRGLDGAFVLACDLPLVTAGSVRALVLAARGADAAAPARRGDPPIEPLCAAYRSSCAVATRTLLDDGGTAAHALFARVRGVRVPLPPDEFLNVNTLADRDRAERSLERGGTRE